MTNYFKTLKHIWTQWIWYAWIAFTIAVCWPVENWYWLMGVNIVYSLVMPFMVMAERYYRELDNGQEER